MRGGADWSLADIRSLAKDAAGDDKDRNELVSLIDRARSLRPEPKKVAAPEQVVATPAP
jgi:hypothetical protein